MKWRPWLWLGVMTALFLLAAERAGAQSPSPVTVIDLLMVYTPAARRGAGGGQNIQSQIQAAVMEANIVLQNSRVNARLRLVRAAEVAYEESGSVSNDLARLRDPKDGFMDGVHTLRDQCAADLVCLVTETGSDWWFYGLQGPSAANAFSVIRRAYLTGGGYLPVVLSFNFGCQLERRYADSVGAFPYSYGYSFTDTNRASFSTVEAFSGTRLPFFSNPGIQYHGVAAGLPAGMLNAADNSRGLNLTAPMVAAFRGGAAVTLPPTIRLTSPLEGFRVRQGTPVGLGATASDADGAVTRVDFYADQTWVGRATHAPFTCSWSNAPCGTHALKALAQDDVGATTTSDAVTMTVSPTNDDFIRAVVLSGTNLTVTGGHRRGEPGTGRI